MTKVYRPTFWAVFTNQLPMALLFAPFILFLSIMVDVLWCFLAWPITWLWVSWSIYSACKIKVTKTKLHGYSTFFLGQGVNVEYPCKWDDITAVKKGRFVFTGLLVLDTNSKEKFFIPTFMQDYDEFKQQVISIAPEGNPLKTYFMSSQC